MPDRKKLFKKILAILRKAKLHDTRMNHDDILLKKGKVNHMDYF